MMQPLRKSRTVYVVLPAYNEGKIIAKLIGDIAEVMDDFGFSYKIIIVDDGSTDDTRQIVEAISAENPILYIVHEKNQGLGATIRDGLLHAAEISEKKDIIITMDADDTHIPGSILQMVRMIYEGYDVVIASRYIRGARVIGLAWYRKVLSLGASVIVQVTFPIRGVKDYTCGYRAYRADMIKRAFERYGDKFVSESGFQCMIDILLKLRTMNAVVGQIPFVLRYDHKVGRSKLPVYRTVVDTIKLLLRRRFFNDRKRTVYCVGRDDWKASGFSDHHDTA
jgi:dolichol-phosphate mannosyltransferase